MGFDTECDLAVEAVAGTPDEATRRAAITRYRDGLLGEHLGAPPDHVAAKLAETGSIIQTIEYFHDPERRRLEPVKVNEVDGVDIFIAKTHPFDPERPVTAEELTSQLMPDLEKPTPKLKFGMVVALVGLMLAGLGALWRFTDLSELATVDGILDWAESLADMPLGPLIGVVVMSSAGSMFPVMVLIAATAIAFGPADWVRHGAGWLPCQCGGAVLGRAAGRSALGPAVRRAFRQQGQPKTVGSGDSGGRRDPRHTGCPLQRGECGGGSVPSAVH